jgi:hypothetical protein
VDWICRDLQEIHIEGNPIHLVAQLSRHLQMKGGFRGHLHTNMRFESEQSPRHAQPHPLVRLQRDYL